MPAQMLLQTVWSLNKLPSAVINLAGKTIQGPINMFLFVYIVYKDSQDILVALFGADRGKSKFMSRVDFSERDFEKECK